MNHQTVKAKKHLGQHFLKDENIALKIAQIPQESGYRGNILEIGPGMGVLTKYLLQNETLNLKVCEIDTESVTYIHKHFPALEVIGSDFLKLDLQTIFNEEFAIIGNFPYNISSQIVFKILDNIELVPFAAGMFQREMARRIAAPHGNKEYGILSVLVQSFYEVKYLFTVNEGVFQPPPKVKSGVISLKRIEEPGNFDRVFFKNVVKTGFNQRRKILRNSLKSILSNKKIPPDPIFDKRPEQLSVKELQDLSEMIRTT